MMARLSVLVSRLEVLLKRGVLRARLLELVDRDRVGHGLD